MLGRRGIGPARGRGRRLLGRSEVDVERDGSLDDRLAARQPAQADQGALAGGDGPAGRREQVGEAQPPARLGQGVGELERPGDLELGGQPLAIVGRRRGQGRLGQVDRPAPSGGRPFHARPLPHRREQVDEAGIDHQALALDHLGVEGDADLLAGPTASITPRRTTIVPGSWTFPGAATIFASLIAMAVG